MEKAEPQVLYTAEEMKERMKQKWCTVRVTHTTTALPNGDCKYTLAYDGHNMGLMYAPLAMHIKTVKAFDKANVAAICTDAPTVGLRGGPAARPVAAGDYQDLRVRDLRGV